jgi:hypothetical protein
MGLVVMAALYFPRPAFAATSTWTGAAGNTLWNDPGNWDTGVPGSGDIALFNTGASPATINVSINVGAIHMAPGYTGTITQATGATVTLTGASFICQPPNPNFFSICQNDGAFIGSNGDINLNGGFALLGGTFNAGSGNVFLPGAFRQVDIFGGTFEASTGTTTINTGEFAAPFNQSGGVFNGHGTVDFICSSFNLTGGTFNATPGNTTFRRQFNHASGTFNPNNGTVILAATQGGNFGTGGTQTFHNLTLNYTGTNHNLANATIVVTGTLRMVSGFPDTCTLKPLGDVVIENTFGPGGDPLTGPPTNITFAGDANAGNLNQTFTNNGGVNLLGTWTVDKTAGRVMLASDLNLQTGQALNITSGTLDQGVSFNLQTSNTLTIGANGVLKDFGTGDLTLGGNLANGGIVNINGGGTGCSDPNVADQILIRSTDTPRTWSGTGTFSLVDVDVDRQDAASPNPGTITAFGSSNLTNTSNWNLNPGCPVEITSQPGNQAVCPGGSASFSVAASGASVSFQWRKNSTPLSNGGNISGADTTMLTINPVGAGDAGSYDAVATSSLGITATSSAATLSLKAAPAITSSPTNVTVCESQSASFTASATGEGISFQWRRNQLPLSNGGSITGANSPMLTINPTVAGDAGSYDVVVSGDCSPPATSSAATLTVNTAPTISSDPANQTACENGLASFTAGANGSPSPTVQWQVSTDGGSNFNDIPGATSATLSFTTNASQDGNKYRAVFANSCSTATTTAATLTVNTAPAVSTNPGDTTVCEGTMASFTAAANGDPSPTVQWQVSTDGTNFSDIVGATSTTLSFTASASQNGNKYRAVFSNTCNTATTSAATLTADGFALSANNQTFTSAGGSGSVDVITGSTCSWTAVSNDSFIQITSGGGGTGNGTVNFTVDPSSSSRTGTMTIAGQTFTVNQNAPTAADGMVGGRILDDNGNPVEGAAVRMSGTQSRLTITDAQGNYRFDNVETNGFYTLTPERVNFTFSPSQRSFSQLGEHTDAAFTASASGGTLNPLDTTEYLVRQQYVDFLGREPDEAGFNFWVNNIEACGADAQCREVVRTNTSAAFFLSIEFQQTGYLVYRMYRSAYGNIPGAPVPVRLGEFRSDSQAIGRGVIVNKIGWEALLENNKQAFIAEFVQRSRFLTAFPESLTPAQFVDTLNQNAGDPLAQSERDQLVNDMTTGAKTRAQVLRAVAEDPDLSTAEFNRAFVLMQYFGYLRRNPNDAPELGLNFDGYNFWLNKLNQFNGNFVEAEMVKAFITSGEYRQRFGP